MEGFHAQLCDGFLGIEVYNGFVGEKTPGSSCTEAKIFLEIGEAGQSGVRFGRDEEGNQERQGEGKEACVGITRVSLPVP